MSAVDIAPVAAPAFATMFSKPEQVGPPKSIMIYGKPGTRKTTIASEIIKLPQFTKVLYIDIDNGSEVFVNDEEVKATVSDEYGAPGVKTINVIAIDKRDENASAMLDYYLGSHDANGFWRKGAAFEGGFYDVIILDSLDVAQEVKVRHFLANTYNEKNVLDSRKAWGEVNKWATDLMWTFQNEKDVLGLVVMHSMTDSEDTGAIAVKPKLQGGAKDTIAGIPSMVVYLEFKEDKPSKTTKLVATVGQSPYIVAKNRYRLPDEIEDFTLPGLYALIDQKQKAGTAPAAPAPATPAAFTPPAPTTQAAA